MIVKLYYSEDSGLLDNNANIFKSEHSEVKHLKNVTASDVELSLIQGSLDVFYENVIIENYQGSWDVLATLIEHSGANNILILTSCLPSGNIMDIIDNEDWKIKPLTSSTKKGYLNSLMSNKYSNLKISKDILNTIKSCVPPCASSINELMENINSLYHNDMLDSKSLNFLLSGIAQDFNFFKFLSLYLEDDKKWIKFFDEGVISAEEFNKFSYSLSYQVMEMKRFIEDEKNKFLEFSDFPKYTIAIYKKLLKKYKGNFGALFDNFIIDLYNLHSILSYTFDVNFVLMKYFLLRNKSKFIKQ